MSQLPALCLSCVHRDPTTSPVGSPSIVRCAAYPDRIPADIARGGDHRTPRGDEVDGIVYDQQPGDAAAVSFDAWVLSNHR